MVNYLHISVLLYPQLADNDVMNTTGGVSPGVGFIESRGRRQEKQKTFTPVPDSSTVVSDSTEDSHLGSSSVMTPFGSASTLLPQNLSLG